jgi:IS30 family transposase
LLYLGMVTVLQSLFTAVTGQSSALSLVLSTLVIAALFNPLRRHIQNVIDRRFYRQKYNAEQALAGFAAYARQETDLDELTSQVAEVVEQTVQPEQVSLWLRRVSNHVQGNKA